MLFEETMVNMGYEGIMLRSPSGVYKFGRSTTKEGILLKLKRFEDSEAIIEDAVEKMHNANEKTLVSNGKLKRNTKKEGLVPTGVLGSVIGHDVSEGRENIIVECGSGFNDAERSELWKMHKEGKLVGRIFKYQYFAGGSKDRPRFPTFKGFRDPGDMS